MTTALIGQLRVAKSGEYTPKATGVTQHYTECSISTELLGKDGELELGLEKVQVSVNALGDLKKNVGKYIAVFHKTTSSKGNTYTFPDDNLEFMLFDKNPLALNINKL